jgi:hypothetical protein
MTALRPGTRTVWRTASEAASTTANVLVSLAGVEGSSGQSQPASYFFAASGFCYTFSLLAKSWADDPPRDDFESFTHVRRPILRRETVPVDSDDLASVAAANLTLSLEESDRYLSAGLRAFERMQGAGSSRPFLVSARADEAREYTTVAVPTLESAAASLDQLHRVIEGFPLRWLTQEPPNRGFKVKRSGTLPRTPEGLSDAVLANLYRIGFPLTMLLDTLALSPARSWSPAITSQAADAFRGLASELQDWTPELPTTR